ncbi:HlyD family efflux transporter periplasmic adaptor subunit [Aerosakkonemataceae cyanobacterium BLCC-F154]|uniref:HlyD family efflux transporter periplasmic adaptor subunit n=1 Tax=Floridaenema fluviatile BLCC-F154 TaxID=3153640 RepID=A0ABV4Y8E7_9CYAN
MSTKQTTEHHTNGNGNGNGKHNSATQMKEFETVWEPKEQPIIRTPLPFRPDDQPVILERPSWWSHAFIWMIIGVTGTGLLWAGFAPLDQTVPAQGKLEAEGAVKELRAPNGGVVRDIFVKDGDRVKQGQVLLVLDSLAPQADLDALVRQRELLLKENQFYNGQFNGSLASASPEFQELLRSKAALVSENQYLTALASGNNSTLSPSSNDPFLANQQGLLAASRAESQSRQEAARLQIQELQAQLAQVQTQLAAAQSQIPMYEQQIITSRQRVEAAQRQLEAAKQQLPNSEKRLATAKELLATDEGLLAKIRPVVEQGALSDLQGRRQLQQVLTRKNEVAASEAEILSRKEQISGILGEIAERQNEITLRQTELLRTKAEAERLQSEQERLNVEIGRAKNQWQNAIAFSEKDVRTKIADNHKRIAEIDSQLARLRLENKKKLDEIDAQIAKAKQAVQFQKIEAPVDGIVFNLKPTGPGYVVRQIDTEPVMSIVPDDKLVAKVYLTNRDIGQVVDRLNRQPEGLPVEVNVESFPSTEFGTLQGKLTSIGSDVLPPTQERPFYSFPATIELQKQKLEINGKPIGLQSGMAVNASVKVRKRTLLAIFTELFQKQVDHLETVR